jgi:hypothetical protein
MQQRVAADQVAGKVNRDDRTPAIPQGDAPASPSRCV